MNQLPLLAFVLLTQADSSDLRPPHDPVTEPGWLGFDSIPEGTYPDESVQVILRLALSERAAAYEGIQS